MPIIDTGSYTLPFVAYDAPVNEKTQKLRDMFKVGENGYPEHYQWRGMARLGPKYDYKDPFVKFDPSDPKEFISSKVTVVGCVTALATMCHCFMAILQSRPMWTKLHQLPLMIGFGSAAGLWCQKKTFERQSKKFGIVMDYARKHPERFGEVKRYKFREVLLTYIPIR